MKTVEIKIIQETLHTMAVSDLTLADRKGNPKLHPSEIFIGTPTVHAFVFLHSGQSSLNSF